MKPHIKNVSFLTRLSQKIRQSITRWTFNSTIRKKLLTSILACAALPIVIALLSNYLIVDPLLLRNLVELERRSLSQYRSDLDYRMDFYETISTIIVRDKELDKMLHSNYTGYLEMTMVYLRHFDTLKTNYVQLNPNFKDICIYNDNPTLANDGSTIKPQKGSFSESGIYNILFENGTGRYITLSDHGIDYYRILNFTMSDSYNFPVLHLTIDKAELSSIAELKSSEEIFLFDPYGNHFVINGSDENISLIETHLTEMGNSGIIGSLTFHNDIIIYDTTNFGWKIVKIIEPITFFDEALSTRNTINILLGFSALLLTLIVFLISGALTKRINLLTDKIESVKNGDYDTHMPIAGFDEIGRASMAMDELSQELKYLIETVYQSNLTNTRLELDMMYAQINPHFLYNTLSAIDWYIQKENINASRELVNSLVLFYRFSLGRGSDIVHLSDEITHLRMYLNIEERLMENIQTEIDIPDEMTLIKLNRMTLQPIVENAINHAVRGKNEILHIHITAGFENDAAVIRVEDDGIGIPYSMAHEFNTNRNISSKRGTGKGLMNVDARIRMHFGEAYGLTICESYESGTCVEIRVPI